MGCEEGFRFAEEEEEEEQHKGGPTQEVEEEARRLQCLESGKWSKDVRKLPQCHEIPCYRPPRWGKIRKKTFSEVFKVRHLSVLLSQHLEWPAFHET